MTSKDKLKGQSGATGVMQIKAGTGPFPGVLGKTWERKSAGEI